MSFEVLIGHWQRILIFQKWVCHLSIQTFSLIGTDQVYMKDILSDVEEESSISKDVMDKVIAELTQAVMKSKNVTTLSRAMNSSSRKNSNSTKSDIESQIGVNSLSS